MHPAQLSFKAAQFRKMCIQYPTLQYRLHVMHLSMLSCWGGGRPGDLTVIIVPWWGFLTVLMVFLATFYWLLVAILTIHKCPAVGHLNRNVQLGSNALPMPGLPPPPPSGLTLIGALDHSQVIIWRGFCSRGQCKRPYDFHTFESSTKTSRQGAC